MVHWSLLLSWRGCVRRRRNINFINNLFTTAVLHFTFRRHYPIIHYLLKYLPIIGSNHATDHHTVCCAVHKYIYAIHTILPITRTNIFPKWLVTNALTLFLQVSRYHITNELLKWRIFGITRKRLTREKQWESQRNASNGCSLSHRNDYRDPCLMRCKCLSFLMLAIFVEKIKWYKWKS